jgi:hypothetical protein
MLPVYQKAIVSWANMDGRNLQSARTAPQVRATRTEHIESLHQHRVLRRIKGRVGTGVEEAGRKLMVGEVLFGNGHIIYAL